MINQPSYRKKKPPVTGMGGSTDVEASSSSTKTFFSGFCKSALRRKSLPRFGELREHDDEGLVRHLGVFELLLLGIGASIGAGIFVVTGTVARDAGPGVTISFILAGAACVLNAFCYAELASRFPAVVGGAYLYSYTAFNELTAFLVFAQLMLDYHIGAASIARSLASYLVSLFELFPFFKDIFPRWIGHDGFKVFGGVLSINILAPILLLILTAILCYGVKESSAVNSYITSLKVIIVILVIFSGAFEVDVSNWSPFAPNGIKAVVTGATVVFFAYVGFDAVANSAEESKRPQRDLPIGILGSLIVCAVMYVCVCLVLTGMVPYTLLGEDAPLAEAFNVKGKKYVSVLISIGAVAGLTTTLLVGLYVQSRLYLGLGRDGMLPSFFAQVHPTRHTPIHSQIWVGCIAGIMGGLFNVHDLSHILSVGSLTGYSVVSACVITLRWKDMSEDQITTGYISSWHEGVISLLIVGFCGFAAGLVYRFNCSVVLFFMAVIIAIIAGVALYFRQIYEVPRSFSCPAVPVLPIVSIFVNIFLFAQLHEEAWIRFIVLSLISVAIYAFYGQYNAGRESSHQTAIYQRAPHLDSE